MFKIYSKNHWHRDQHRCRKDNSNSRPIVPRRSNVVSTRSTNCRGKLQGENPRPRARYARRRKKCRQGRSYHAGTRCSPSRENDKSHQSYSLTRISSFPPRTSLVLSSPKKIAYSLTAKIGKLSTSGRERAMSSRAARLEESGEEWNGDEGTGENGVKMFPRNEIARLGCRRWVEIVS